MLRKDKKAPGDVADDLLQTLTNQIQARTEVERDRVTVERDRQEVLQALRGDIQAISLGLGELVGKVVSVETRLAALEEFQRGFALYIGGELRLDMQKTRTTILEVSELLEKALRGWTQAARAADKNGVEVVKPPGYDL